MKIIWGKWVLQQLPEVLRTTLVYTFCMVFISPIRGLYMEFSTWKNKQQIKAGGSPQVCMLKKVIFDELGINVEIEEENGKPYDFIIKAAFSNVDKERQLFALLDRYKLAGRSYRYKNAEISIITVWTGFVCEQRAIIAEWSRYVCEIKERPINYIRCKLKEDIIFVTPDFAPTSILFVRFEVSLPDLVTGEYTYSVVAMVSMGIASTTKELWKCELPPSSASLNITEDSNYLYQIKWE